MTGNELDIHMKVNPPWSPAESISHYLRETGENVLCLRETVKSLQRSLVECKQSRLRLVATMKELQGILGLPYPDPTRIVMEVMKLQRSRYDKE